MTRFKLQMAVVAPADFIKLHGWKDNRNVQHWRWYDVATGAPLGKLFRSFNSANRAGGKAVRERRLLELCWVKWDD